VGMSVYSAQYEKLLLVWKFLLTSLTVLSHCHEPKISMSKPKPKTTRKQWTEVEISYIISQWNDIESTGITVKSEICKEIGRRMKSWPQRTSGVDRTEDQIRRKIERVLGDQDPRIPTWKFWVRDNGSVRSEKSEETSTPKVTSRTERNTRTYPQSFDDESINAENDNEYEDISYTLKTPQPVKSKKRKIQAEEVEELPEVLDKPEEIHYSPGKPTSSFPPLLLPRTIFDSQNGTYWTFVRVPQGLTPILDETHPKMIFIDLSNAPPTSDEMEDFPQEAVQCLQSFHNQSLVGEKNLQKLRIQIEPPTFSQEWDRVIVAAKKNGGATHHLIVHWQHAKSKITKL